MNPKKKSPDLVALRSQCSWSRAARALIPPPTNVRALNGLVNRAARLALSLTLQQKSKALFLPLVEHLELGVPSFSLDVSWTDDTEIRVYNRDYRGKDKATDVLSFPFWEGETLFEGDETPLGDLVLSLETALRQADELKHSLEHELAFLTIHGTLHLLGFDHDTPAKRRAMFAWQDELAALLELGRAAA